MSIRQRVLKKECNDNGRRKGDRHITHVHAKGNTCVGRLMASTALARVVEEQVLSRYRSSPGTGPTLCFQETTVYFSSLI
jgi:hypothetical protein